MSVLSSNDHPVLFVLAVGAALFGLSHLLWLLVETKGRLKSRETKTMVKITIYLTTACLFLGWACVFLAQVRPMIMPEK